MDAAGTLCLVLDLNWPSWSSPAAVVQLVHSLVLFANLHLAQNQSHSMAVFLARNRSSELLWQSSGALHMPAAAILGRIKEALADDMHDAKFSSAIASAVSKALCYLNSRPLSAAGPLGRVLIATPGSGHADHYVAMMNSAFAAQKLDIPIDVLQVGKEDSPLLHQLCFLSDGLYQHAETATDALHLLLAYYGTAEAVLRPDLVSVDFRAACFCHGQVVDTGFVCSVCLSVFCKFSPICPSCKSKFEFPSARK